MADDLDEELGLLSDDEYEIVGMDLQGSGLGVSPVDRAASGVIFGYSSGPPQLLKWLKRLDREHGTDTMRGARAAVDGCAEEALAAWGMTAEMIDHVTAPDTALSYFALMDGLRRSMPGTAALNSGMRKLYGNCATSLVQGSLRGTNA